MLYAYNLKTRHERLLINLKANQIPAVYEDALIGSPTFNGTHLFWTEGYPASCLPRPTCEQVYKNVCQRKLFSYDLQTKTRQVLGFLSYGTFISGWPTSTKLILYTKGAQADCYPKVSSGAPSVFDIPSRKILSLDGGPAYFGYAYLFIQANGDIITYGHDGTDATYTQLIHFDGVQEPQALVSIDKIAALGQAGLGVLLYAPGGEHVYGPRGTLRALDIKTGWTQILDEVDNIQRATGDSDHFAWTTYDGDLYVAPVNLAPAPNATPIKTRVPPKLWWKQTQIEPVR